MELNILARLRKEDSILRRMRGNLAPRNYLDELRAQSGRRSTFGVTQSPDPVP